MRGSRLLTTAAQRIRSTTTTKQIITLTDSAASRILHLLQKQNKPYLRLGIASRGCTGLTYTLNYADEIGKVDEVVHEKGVSVLVESKAVLHIIGMKMDFVDDILRSEFVFINPKATKTCGCGESFMTT